MKKLITALLAVMMAFAMASCGSSEPASASSGAASATDASEVEIPEVDLNNVYADIKADDLEGFTQLMDEITNFKTEGATIKLEGVLTKTPTHMSISQKTGDGSSIGFTLEVKGFEKEDYPEEGTPVALTGVVVTDGMAHYIYVLPENFTVVE